MFFNKWNPWKQMERSWNLIEKLRTIRLNEGGNTNICTGFTPYYSVKFILVFTASCPQHHFWCRSRWRSTYRADKAVINMECILSVFNISNCRLKALQQPQSGTTSHSIFVGLYKRSVCSKTKQNKTAGSAEDINKRLLRRCVLLCSSTYSR